MAGERTQEWDRELPKRKIHPDKHKVDKLCEFVVGLCQAGVREVDVQWVSHML